MNQEKYPYENENLSVLEELGVLMKLIGYLLLMPLFLLRWLINSFFRIIGVEDGSD